MQHYSNDLEEAEAEDCSHEVPSRAPEANLDERLPVCFGAGPQSAGSVSKANANLNLASYEKEANRAFLEDNLLGPVDSNITEFKTNLNFEFKAAIDSDSGSSPIN